MKNLPTETSPAAPVVPADVQLPEITLKAVVLSIVLAAVLAAANAYLGLFAGMTVSASIPAAVVSMAVLRMFRHSNILENNIVQTAASSGEALAAGIIFTIPALLLIGHWTVFDYRQTMTIGLVGGLLGVLFTIPLRRTLVVEAGLRYPEGLATAEVLKVGSMVHVPVHEDTALQAGGAMRGFQALLLAAGIGATVKLAESGARLWTEALEGAACVGGTVFYGGINLSPALIAVGFIIGANTAWVVFLGGAMAAWVFVPLYGVVFGVAEGTAMNTVQLIWKSHIRYVGIGAMLIGGLWTLFQLRGSLWAGLHRAVTRASRVRHAHAVELRTERDAPLPWIVIPFVLTLIPMAMIYTEAVGSVGVALVMTVIMSCAAFLFSAVAGYMAGLVGSSSNPVSGVTIATIALSAVILALLMGYDNPAGPAAALLIGAVVCCAAAMGGDNLQDLKTGHVVGATPWKQQIMQVVGVATGACVIVPVLSLLQAKYGIGEITAEHPHPLMAPQATVMASLAQGVFGDSIPWNLVLGGAALGVLVILFDRRQQARDAVFRMPVLAFALGLYLPLKLSAAILVGGLVAECARRARGSHAISEGSRGLLCAAGLVTGEALMGIVLAVPVALSGVWPGMPADPVQLFDTPPWNGWPGFVIVVAVGIWLFKQASRGERMAVS